MAASSRAANEHLTGPRPHILGVPLETRLTIYGHIVNNIQHERRHWERNTVSTYDGLLLACKQLSCEASRYIFSTRITSHQISKITNMSVSRLTFSTLRSLSIEVDLKLDAGDIGKLVTTLDYFQLSLQELHLLFFGQDCNGEEVVTSGCANRGTCLSSTRMPLLESGQDTEKKLNLFRVLVRCRNLRILRIDNLNLPILPAVFMIGKPYLQAFSATCDQRSIVHAYTKSKHLLRGLLIKVDSKRTPPIETLHLDANAAVPAEDIVLWLRTTLKHLSWRIPNADYQDLPTKQNEFYQMTNRISQILWSSDRTPNLETLRLCCDMCDLPARHPKYQMDFGNLEAMLNFDLPKFQKLRYFEIHYSGQDEFEFVRHHLVENLPHGLERLYLSDRTITAEQLVGQVEKRYFCSSVVEHSRSCIPLDEGFFDCTDNSIKPEIESLPLYTVPIAEYVHVNDKGHAQYVSAVEAQSLHNAIKLVKRSKPGLQNYPDDGFMIGESKFRRDEIPLNNGKLGFVTFEYAMYDDSDDCCERQEGSNIFKLNGQLLDREQNLHLAYGQAVKKDYGIKPPQEHNFRGDVDCLPETGTYSKHPSIYAAIYNNANFAPKSHLVEQNRKDLATCPQRHGILEQHGSMDWYFGNEHEAMQVFEHEPVAKIEDQRQKPMLMEVEVRPTNRCQWMCPDFEIPPVGSFPTPPIPSDWKELARAS